uniref:Uncharacterized protein n=1 Tax=Lotus japonicus TaxID=34305 RepID=I3T2K4_LOTJA|nr:unknown [Lotus japonicus]
MEQLNHCLRILTQQP